jgi:DNA invertase Pin-like site-specific DNA recombinase
MARDDPGSSQRRRYRCAVYTRKSTEEGLDQAFNSLDAQREACSAYIASQRHEGWELVREHYDDGGFSGGNLDRPGLQRLLKHVAEGKVDVLVVYKVDRLTRSLADFAKIVEALDAENVSFVSITQAFNTTTSMGRLTLNVLLSFAQFEREVIAERVRDKIAASKAKGMWMGGRVPLGYDARDRKLVINEVEAETVRGIMRRYLELGQAPALIQDLEQRGIITKVERRRDGSTSGGIPFTRGSLYHLLKNPIYRGKVTHHDKVYDGQHESIVDDELFEQVQGLLRRNNAFPKSRDYARSPTLLAGMVRDHVGRPMSPHHAVKNQKRYQYYVSNEPSPAISPHAILRVPARELDEAVILATQTILNRSAQLARGNEPAKVLTHLRDRGARLADILPKIHRVEQRRILTSMDLRIVIYPRHAVATCSRQKLLLDVLKVDGLAADEEDRVVLPMALVPTGGHGTRLRIEPRVFRQRTEDKLTEMLVRAHEALDRLTTSTEPIEREERRHLNRTARGAFLAPDIVAAILSGTQPEGINIRRITRGEGLPLDWASQRKVLGLDRVRATEIAL